jgi:ankyrin repeat protein
MMNRSEKRLSSNRPFSKKQFFIGRREVDLVLAVAMLTWCAAVQGAEIHEAAELGNLDKVKACLSQDPKLIDSKDAKGRTVMARASLSGKKEVVEFLLENGAVEDIFAAAIVGHTDKVDAFLKQDKNLVNARDKGGKEPLHWAALYGQKEVADLLLAQKADVNALDEQGFTPLHWAAMFNRSDVTKVLLTNKADMNLKAPRFGWTPLRLAVLNGNLSAAEALLNGGADPNVKDDENIPLLHQAVIGAKKEMVELLLARKANVNTKDSAGESALDEAVEQGNKEIIEILRKHGGKEK